jgi:hypothetical protein
MTEFLAVDREADRLGCVTRSADWLRRGSSNYVRKGRCRCMAKGSSDGTGQAVARASPFCVRLIQITGTTCRGRKRDDLSEGVVREFAAER